MRILLVKLSSLGDVVHTLPVVQDILRELPAAQIDWVVERAFAPLPALLPGVQRVVACDIRRWRKSLFSRTTRLAWRQFCAELQAGRYDAIIDLQGLSKSGFVARLAHLAPGGKRFAMANRTDGSGYEAPTRWLADVALPLPAHIHAVARGRLLAALALGYAVPVDAPDFGLRGVADSAFKKSKKSPFSASKVPASPETPARAAIFFVAPGLRSDTPHSLHSVVMPIASSESSKPLVVWVHGSSRADKCWPAAHWLALGQRLHSAGWQVALVHGNTAEEATSRELANALNAAAGETAATVWPRLPLDALTRQLAQACSNQQPGSETGPRAASGVIGVDSGISHIAVALGLPHVQLYNFDTAWRTGPLAHPLQTSVFGQPAPSVDAVWQAWLACTGNSGNTANSSSSTTTTNQADALAASFDMAAVP